MNIKGSTVVKHFKDNRWITGTITDDDECIQVTWCYGKIENYQKDTTQLLVYDIGPLGKKQSFFVFFTGKIIRLDLLLLSLSTLGVCHETITCDGCKTQKICDLRWKCTVCYDFDLCSACFHNNTHNTEHVFKRFDVPGATYVFFINDVHD